MTQNDALAAYLGPELFARLDWAALNDAQRDAILSVFRVGICAGAQSGAVSVIDTVLGDGRVVICEDGTRWTAREEDDAELIDDWGEGALIAIHRGLVYRLDPYQAAEVELLDL
ncbi:hypothetical protein U91I_03678 [alpha proteobacterium U9-1i]|nr:hypothetical protein U91I_03678 [alpha proteobacterium U9-1i]